MVPLTLLAALLLALVHIVTPSMRFLEGTPRSIWLSLAGGVSVAYIFVHLLPELAAGQASIARAAGDLFVAERHVYLIALAGLLAFYGLDRMAKLSRSQRGRTAGGGRAAEAASPADTSASVFWIHMASFSIYNALVGYLLLHREATGLSALAFFAFAMALHFVVTDFGLHDDHKRPYRRIGRWVLVGAVLAGWGFGLATEISEATVAALIAFLGGGVVLNVLKEEVPSERQSRFWAFALGAGGYAALLLAV